MKAALSSCLFSCAAIIVLCLQTRTCGSERSLVLSSGSGRGYIDRLLDKQSCKIMAYTYRTPGLTSIYSLYRYILLGPIAILRYIVMTLNYYVMHMLHLTRALATSCICLATVVIPAFSKPCGFYTGGDAVASAKVHCQDAASGRTH